MQTAIESFLGRDEMADQMDEINNELAFRLNDEKWRKLFLIVLEAATAAAEGPIDLENKGDDFLDAVYETLETMQLVQRQNSDSDYSEEE